MARRARRSDRVTDTHTHAIDIPKFENNETFHDIVYKLQQYFLETIDQPLTFDQLRTTKFSGRVKPLINNLADGCYNPAIVAALLCCKAIFANDEDDRGVNEGRGFACELVAWRFLTHLNQSEIIDYLCYELPPLPVPDAKDDDDDANSTTSLLPLQAESQVDENAQNEYVGLNTLELAVVCNAKKFLMQNNIQRVVNGIWDGNIIFWETLKSGEVKKARIYNKRRADPYCRLRIPKYQKVFEAIFLAIFLALYYAVLVQRDIQQITGVEVCLYLMFLSLLYDEISQFADAGSLFYAADIFSWIDFLILAIFVVFLVFRVTGLVRHDDDMINTSFDVLSLEALLLLPRIFSLFSLTKFFGTLLPALKSMTVEFFKFLSLVIVLYCGFLTTFCMISRDNFTFKEMSWILIKVFYGSTYLGFDNMLKISPLFGAPLMLIFVTLTNILLVTSLISLLSNKLSDVLSNSKEEYLFMFSTYVLEASTSNRLTYFTPPLNLIALAVRPFRIVLSAERQRGMRISLLKATHFPLVIAIMLYEKYTHADWASQDAQRKQYAIRAPNSPRITPASLSKSNSSMNMAKKWKRAILGNQFSLSASKGKNIDTTNAYASKQNSAPPTPGEPLERQLHRNDGDPMDSTLVTHEDLVIQLERVSDAFAKKIDELVKAIEAKERNN